MDGNGKANITQVTTIAVTKTFLKSIYLSFRSSKRKKKRKEKERVELS